MPTEPLKQQDWLGKDVWLILSPYQKVLRQFVDLRQYMRNCVMWLYAPLTGPVVLSLNTRLKFDSAVRVFDVHASITGPRVGFVFVTPLTITLHQDVMLAHRAGTDFESEIAGAATASRKYQIHGLLFFEIEDRALMISTVSDTKLVEALE